MKKNLLIALISIAGLFAVTVLVAAIVSNRNTNSTPQELLSKSEPTSELDVQGFEGGDAAGPSGPGFDSPAGYGDTVTFPNGLSVTISKVTYGPANADYPGNYDLYFTVEVKNDSGQRVEGVMSSVETPAEEFMGPSFDTDSMPTLFAGDEGSEVQGVMVKQDIKGETIRISVPDPLDYGMSAVWEGKV